MSSSNKSSFKTSNTSTLGSYEDDLLAWLQYPTDNAFERTYCSDVGFQEEWPPVPAAETAHNSNPDVISHEHEGLSTSMGTSISVKDIAPRTLETKSTLISKASCAEKALALGAARAAGQSSLAGQDSHRRVKTLMQPSQAHHPLSTPCSSFDARKGLKDHHIKPSVPISSVPISALNPLQNARSSKGNVCLESSPLIKTKHTLSESATCSSKRGRTEYEAHSHTHQTESSHITEENTIERGKMVARVYQRFAMTSTSCSGASQSSMSLSGWDMAHNGKHKQDSEEVFTEEYAEDDLMGTKNRSKPPSKRNRVAEVHNLSEKNRRNRINEKLKTLQDLIPNSSKTDKASILDEAIEYMKTLQMQLQMVSMRNSMNVPTMAMPMNAPQSQMHMVQPHSIGLGVPILGHATAMGMGLGMGIPESGPSTATNLLQMPAAMSQLHAMQLYNGNMAGFAHMGFLQNLPYMANMQEPYELSMQRPTAYMHQHQQFEQRPPSLLCQTRKPEHEAVSIEQDDVSE